MSWAAGGIKGVTPKKVNYAFGSIALFDGMTPMFGRVSSCFAAFAIPWRSLRLNASASVRGVVFGWRKGVRPENATTPAASLAF
jgi:hypothetical protein